MNHPEHFVPIYRAESIGRPPVIPGAFLAAPVLMLAMVFPVAAAAPQRSPGPLPSIIPAREKFLASTWIGTSMQSGEPDPLLGTLFDGMTPENCGKWGVVERERGKPDFGPFDQMTAHAVKHKMVLKHHGLVWGMQQPKWQTEVTDPAAMRATVDTWIRVNTERYGKSAAYVDVLNEPLTQPAGYRDVLGGAGETGWDWVIWTFERARHHQKATGATWKLILNEIGIEGKPAKAAEFRKIVELLQARGLVDVIGLQCHFMEKTPAKTYRQVFDDMAATGLPIVVSEFDVNIADDAGHAAKFKELFAYFWENPRVAGVTVWGHRQGFMWRNDSWLVAEDGRERAALVWLRQYLKKSGRADLAAAPAATPWAPKFRPKPALQGSDSSEPVKKQE